MAHLEEIRASTADLIGLSGVLAVPKIALLAPPRSEDVDIVARAVSMGRIHRTFPATGAMALAAAVVLPGTTAHALARPSDTIDRTVRIGHPAGAIEIGIDVQRVDGQWLVRSATTYRTARKIMDGCVYVPASYLTESAWFDA
jgi:2-methylaconitate cis-trans-isomerase PrpF